MSNATPETIALTGQEFGRIVNNYYTEKGIDAPLTRVQTDLDLFNYVLANMAGTKQKHRIALCFICVNEPYWRYIEPVFNGARGLFMPGHDTDLFIWSDKAPDSPGNLFGATHYPVEPMEWPMGTLMRYALMLQAKAELEKYDYVFYCDIDMAFVNFVGDEILADGITAAQHPMYALDRKFCPPYEPDPASQAYIPRPGVVVADEGRHKQRFMPLYFAGGFQGGKTAAWLAAMEKMKAMIETDLGNGYVPIWNDESIWNRYLFDNPPAKVLTPSYIYPDSLIEEYYKPIWGTNYPPRLVTLTKPFTVTSGAGEATAKAVEQLKALK